MPEPRTFLTDPGGGGVESEALGLPFTSTPIEDWYGFGDIRSPNRYKETGDLETDIKSLKKWIDLYRVGSGWHKLNSDELYRKQAEVAEIQRQRAWLQLSDEEQQRQQRLVQVSEAIAMLEQKLISEQKLKAGYYAGHYILTSGRFDTIPILQEQIEQKKTRN